MAPTMIRRAALALPSEERAALAAELLASLDEGGDEVASDSEWDSAWGDELDAGRVEAVSADEVFADARRRRAAHR